MVFLLDRRRTRGPPNETRPKRADRGRGCCPIRFKLAMLLCGDATRCRSGPAPDLVDRGAGVGVFGDAAVARRGVFVASSDGKTRHCLLSGAPMVLCSRLVLFVFRIAMLFQI